MTMPGRPEPEPTSRTAGLAVLARHERSQDGSGVDDVGATRYVPCRARRGKASNLAFLLEASRAYSATSAKAGRKKVADGLRETGTKGRQPGDPFPRVLTRTVDCPREDNHAAVGLSALGLGVRPLSATVVAHLALKRVRGVRA